MNLKHTVKVVGLMALLGVLVSGPLLFVAKNIKRFSSTPSSFGATNSYKLEYSGEPFTQSIELIKRELRSGECVLLFRQAEFAYYQNGCVINYLDPRLLDFYKSDNKAQAFDFLAELDVRFIVVPNRYGMTEVLSLIHI